MSQIKVTWKAFGEDPAQGKFITSVEFDHAVSAEWQGEQRFLDKLYEETNLHRGKMWDVIQPRLNDSRTHTSLSVGDEIEITHSSYRVLYGVANTGFEIVEIAETTRAGE